MQEKTLNHELKQYGPPHVDAYVYFTPNGSTGLQTLIEAMGVESVNCTVAGKYTITFSQAPAAIIPLQAQHIENDTTTFHFTRVESLDVPNKQAVVSHKAVAYASIASGPALSDTVDGLVFAFRLRKKFS